MDLSELTDVLQIASAIMVLANQRKPENVARHWQLTQRRHNFEALSSERFTSRNSLIRESQCMIIGSFGDKYAEGIKYSFKRKMPLGAEVPFRPFLAGVRADTEKLQDLIRKDKDKELVYSLMDIPGVQETKQFYIERIKKLFRECCKDGALIYYTGHGETGTGNWCFRDGTISFQEIFGLYFDHFRGKLLYIFTDCCYSGRWVVELANYLDEMGIAACGQHAREEGVLIKIVASCEPDQKAADGAFSNKGFWFDEVDKKMRFSTSDKLSETQNVCGCDFTRTMCYQLEGPNAPCRISEIPAEHQLKWKDVISWRSNPAQKTYLLSGKYRGRKAWRSVVVPGRSIKAFEAQVQTGTIAVTNYGFIIASGFGENPPDDIYEKWKSSSPNYFANCDIIKLPQYTDIQLL